MDLKKLKEKAQSYSTEMQQLTQRAQQLDEERKRCLDGVQVARGACLAVQGLIEEMEAEKAAESDKKKKS